MKRTIFGLGIAAAMTMAGSVSAATLSANSVTCVTNINKGSTATYQIDDAVDALCLNHNKDQAGDINGTSGDGAFTGVGAFGFNDWLLAEKSDGPDGSGYISFSTSPINDVKSGNFEIDVLPSNVVSVLVTLKSAKNGGVFLMDLGDLASAWSISKNLSHASLYYRIDDTVPGGPSPVPLPASGLLLVAAMGTLMARRRRT